MAMLFNITCTKCNGADVEFNNAVLRCKRCHNEMLLSLNTSSVFSYIDQIKVFLDDVRDAPDGWIQAYTAQETIMYLQNYNVTHLSLDHDLGDEICGTGYDILAWLEKEVHEGRRGYIPEITIHSANPPAAARMLKAVQSMKRYLSNLTAP